MKNREEILETIETITNRLNPLWRREIQEIDSEIFQALEGQWQNLSPHFINLRGVSIDNLSPIFCDRGYQEDYDPLQFQPLRNWKFPQNLVHDILYLNESLLSIACGSTLLIYDFFKQKILSYINLQGTMRSITKISETVIAFGGDDEQITLVDISNPTNPKILPNPIHAKNLIHSITKISKTVIAFGGDYRQIILADISNPTNPQILPNPIHAKGSIFSITKISETVIAFGG
ncbi:MAG: hypothetical protein DSY46_07700, partial [Hydrogenimonas sp.]